jgi:pyrimidine operon attenuation protein/uracil phosphoribosyltransferase
MTRSPSDSTDPSASGASVPHAEAVFAELKAQVASRLAAATPGQRPVLVGIHTGGAWVAHRLHRELCPDAPLGFLSSAFHRDDYSARGLRTSGTRGTTQIDFKVDGTDILLIDDVLYTGRTVRAALNELFDYGRPARVALAVLLDRGGRELPVQADHVGAMLPLAPGQGFVLGRADDGRFTLLAMDCLGSCDTAPVALFNETLHEQLTVEKLDKLIDQAQADTKHGTPGGHH